MTLLFVIVFSLKSSAQSSKHDNERIEADALAAAYISCDYDLTLHEYLRNKDDKRMKMRINELSLLKSRLFVQFENKYKTDIELKNRFDKKVKEAKKKLKNCIKYKEIMETRAESELQKTKKTN